MELKLSTIFFATRQNRGTRGNAGKMPRTPGIGFFSFFTPARQLPGERRKTRPLPLKALENGQQREVSPLELVPMKIGRFRGSVGSRPIALCVPLCALVPLWQKLSIPPPKLRGLQSPQSIDMKTQLNNSHRAPSPRSVGVLKETAHAERVSPLGVRGSVGLTDCFVRFRFTPTPRNDATFKLLMHGVLVF
jgi:hypothetical protein